MSFDPSTMSHVDSSDDPQAHVRYLEDVAQALRERRLEHHRKLDLQSGQRFLDVGCGTGEVLEEVARIVGESGRIAGIDGSQTMVDASRARLAAAGVVADIRQADAHALPFDDCRFDRVRCERVLQHLEDPALAVREMFPVLVPGGRVLLIDPNHEQADIATDDPAAFRVARSQSTGRVRHPRAGLHLTEWASSAGFAELDFYAAALLFPWSLFRSALLLDEGAERAIAASELSRGQWDRFTSEQAERQERRTAVASVIGYGCLGTKPSSAP